MMDGIFKNFNEYLSRFRKYEKRKYDKTSRFRKNDKLKDDKTKS